MNKLIGPPISYVDLLDDRLQHDAEKEKPKYPLRPSSAGECERALAYKMMLYTGNLDYKIPTIEPRVQRIFEMGHAVETMLMKLFARVEYFHVQYAQQTLTFFQIESSNKKIAKLIEGSNDGCFVGVSEDDKFKCVFDVKSKATGIGGFRKTKWEEQDAKFDEMKTVERFSPTGVWVNDLPAFLKELDDDMFKMNFWQLNLYLNSEFMKQRGFDHGSIIQFSKDDSKMREIRFRPDAGLAKLTQERFQKAANAATNLTPEKAKKEFVLGSQKCAFCDFKGLCWEGDDALKKYFNVAFKAKKWPVDLEGHMAEELRTYHELLKADALTSKAKKNLVQYCIDNGFDKIQTNARNSTEKIIYEVKKLKTTIDFRRSKV